MGKSENVEDKPKPSTSSAEVSSKSKPRSQGKKRKRETSESSNDEIILPDNALETERNVHASAVKNNLDETSVRKIIKKVVTNDHVLALVKLREEEDDSSTEDKNVVPKLTRAKVKELKKVSACKSAAWDLEKLELTPIKHIPVKTRPEVTALIAHDLPEDEDDDEYEPTHDEVPSDDDHVESCSDLDSQPRTPATPATPSPKVVRDGPFKVPQDISKARRKLEIEEEEATIALRTRSKLSLSATSIEHIESTFVPPDDIPNQDVDDLWSQFLNECLNPASVAKHEDDDDTDPEYNVAADPDAADEDEDALSNSIIKISKKELNDLVTELFSILPETAEEELAGDLANSLMSDTTQNKISHWEGKKEPVSDDEEMNNPSQRLRFENDEMCEQLDEERHIRNKESKKGKEIAMKEKETARNKLRGKELLLKDKEPEPPAKQKPPNIDIAIEEGDPPPLVAEKPPPALRDTIRPSSQTVHIRVDSSVVISQNQLLLLQQQLRQHIQLATSNFMQTVVHPVHWKLAPQYKEYLESLMNLARNNPKSVTNVCNLKPAHDLITNWEKCVTEDTEENRKMVEFLTMEVERCRRRIHNNSLYNGNFHETFMKVVANSTVFLYPYLLPCMLYRPDVPKKFCYLPSEDTLITLGLDQFWTYVEGNPQIYKLNKFPMHRGRRGLMATLELVSKHMFPWSPPNRLAGHIQAIKSSKDEQNPIYRYFKYNELPKVEHTLLPFNPCLTLYEQPEHEMPRVWARYLAKNSLRFRKHVFKRNVSFTGHKPSGVKIDCPITDTTKRPLPIDFTKTIISSRASLVDKLPQEEPTSRLDINIKKVDQNNQNTVLTAQNFYRLVDTSTGAYLVPLQVANTVHTTTANTSSGCITTPAEVSTILKNNLPETRPKSLQSLEHCECCYLLRKISKKRQSRITEFLKGPKVERKCFCNSIENVRITNRLRMLVSNSKKKSELVFMDLNKRINNGISGCKDDDLNSKDLAHVLTYQIKLFTLASMSKRIQVKKRVHNLLSHFDLDSGEPTQLALDLFKVFDVELVDLYLDFLSFLTPKQAEQMSAFKAYFIRSCVEGLVRMIEEQVSDKGTRSSLLIVLRNVVSRTMSACEMCSALLKVMNGYEKLAVYTFSLFPHSKEFREHIPRRVNPTRSLEDHNETGNTTLEGHATVDYEADHSSSEEESDVVRRVASERNQSTKDTRLPKTTEPIRIEMKMNSNPDTNNLAQPMSVETEDSDSDYNLSIDETEIKSEMDISDWKKEEDRTILQVLQEHLTKEERKDKTIIDLLEEKNVYGMLVDSLDRSLSQIKERVMYLLKVLVVSESDT